jgi:multicomponent Na+:H+ antiporter subunit F
MNNAYSLLFTGALLLIGVLLIACLIRAIKGPRVADRLIAVNMTGTLIVICICILSFLLCEGYLVDIAMIYTMLSFLAVVLLTKVYMGIYRDQKHAKEEQHDA